MTPEQVVALLQSAGLLGGFVVLFGLLLTGKLVFGWVYKAAEAREAEYKRLLFDAMNIAERGAKVGEQAQQVVLQVQQAKPE